MALDWEILKIVKDIQQKVGLLMATEADLQAAITALTTDVNNEIAAFQALVASLKAGQPVTQAQLDALTTSITNLDTAVKAVVVA